MKSIYRALRNGCKVESLLPSEEGVFLFLFSVVVHSNSWSSREWLYLRWVLNIDVFLMIYIVMHSCTFCAFLSCLYLSYLYLGWDYKLDIYIFGCKKVSDAVLRVAIKFNWRKNDTHVKVTVEWLCKWLCHEGKKSCIVKHNNYDLRSNFICHLNYLEFGL